jgi:hypothetical protein
MAEVVLTRVLAAQADGRARFDVAEETLGEALRGLPVADLLFDAHGEWSPLLNVYVDGKDARELGGLECPLAGVREVRIVGMIAGG